MKVTKNRKSHVATGRANLIKFCEILDDLPINFSFHLRNVSEDFNGSWKKTVLNGTTEWQNGSRILLNSSFFPKKNQVLEAIEREGWRVKKSYFPDTKRTPLLMKGKVRRNRSNAQKAVIKEQEE